MNAAGRAHLLGILQARREAIAACWYGAIARAGFATDWEEDVPQRLLALTDQVIALLLAEPFRPQEAQGLGTTLIRLGYGQPAALGRTQDVLAQELLAGLPAEEIVALQPRLAALLSAVAAGFVERLRATILAEQETIRSALLTERQRAEAALRQAEERLRLVVTNAPVVLFAVDRAGVLTLAEGKGLDALGLLPGNVVGRSVFAGPTTVPEIRDHVCRALVGEAFTATVEVAGVMFETRYAPLRDQRGAIIGVIGVASDITARVRAEAARQASEARFRTLFEEAAIGIALADLAGRLVESNPALQVMLGYRSDELRGLVFTEFTHPDDVAAGLDLYQELVAGTRDHYQLEKRYLRKDGQVVWGHLTVSLVRDAVGEPQYALGMVEDITARQRVNVELAEARLRLIESREAAQQHLARELHDGPVQDLYGARFQLEPLAQTLPDESGRAQLAAVQATLERVTTALRAICGELRPPTLTPFGLAAAIRSHAERVQQMHPALAVRLELIPDGQALLEPVRLALFRIYQEALRNVVQHAGAKSVLVRLMWDAEQVMLEVRDDGRGFVVPERWAELARHGHLGLLGAAERTEAIGARLEVISTPEQGTIVRVVVPRPGEDHPTHTETRPAD